MKLNVSTVAPLLALAAMLAGHAARAEIMADRPAALSISNMLTAPRVEAESISLHGSINVSLRAINLRGFATSRAAIEESRDGGRHWAPRCNVVFTSSALLAHQPVRWPDCAIVGPAGADFVLDEPVPGSLFRFNAKAVPAGSSLWYRFSQ